jgi:aminoglycoside 6-adenylyltransferase
MRKIIRSYEELIKKITNWAKVRQDVRAAVILGSRARAIAPADEWSDLNIVLIVNSPSFYLDNTDWLNKISEVKILFQSL